MSQCALCKNSPADKKGSHIVPHFLLKRIENLEGKKGRGYELGFSFNGMFTSSYFGESVLPEKLDQIYGDLTDEEIESNSHPLIVDFIFCTSCEKRLSIIESEYSSTLKKIDTVEYESGISGDLGILFWGSVLWRMSIHGESGFSLSSENNEKLRSILNKFLPIKLSDLNTDEFKKSEFVNSISYKLLRCSNCKDTDSKWLLLLPHLDNPLCLLIDEFVLAFAIKGNYEDLDNHDCFGLNDLLKSASTTTFDSMEKITLFDRDKYKSVEAEILEKLKERYIADLFEFCDRVHVACGGNGTEMPEELKKTILASIVSGENKLGRRYQDQEIAKVAMEAMKNYRPRTL